MKRNGNSGYWLLVAGCRFRGTGSWFRIAGGWLTVAFVFLLVWSASSKSMGQETGNQKPATSNQKPVGSPPADPASATTTPSGVPATAIPASGTKSGSSAVASGPAKSGIGSGNITTAASPGPAAGSVKSGAPAASNHPTHTLPPPTADAWRDDWHKKWIAEHVPPTAKAGPVNATREQQSTPAVTINQPLTTSNQQAPITSNQPPATSNQPPATGADSTNALTGETRPDVFGTTDLNASTSKDHTLNSPFSAIGDSWKMIAYLIPVLLLLIGGLNLLRRFQERTGRIPGLLQSAVRETPRAYGAPQRTGGGGLMSALIGGFHLNQARNHGGGSIRLVESVPIGNANLHLVEVHGRLLLLGATGGGIALLTEFAEQNPLGTDDFRALLHAAAVDMDSLDLDASGLPAAAMVGTLEEGLRDTGDTLARRARRLRTVQEEEESYVQG